MRARPTFMPPPPPSATLFGPRFFLMCGFSFTVFLSAFQLLPTAPFRILDLGGTKLAAGMFLGCLAYASAFSAPITGALGDRFGRRRMLITCSLAIAGFSAAYAVTDSYHVILAIALVHGLFWSGLLSSSAAYVTDFIPEHRRAEGISYWGLATVAATAIAPSIGLWVYGHGWRWLCATTGCLNLGMAAIAATLPHDDASRAARPPFVWSALVEWRVMVVSGTLFLYSFGYGAITSFAAVYAAASGVTHKGVFFTALAVTILVTRPFSGRIADRVGYRKVMFPCFGLIVAGLALLAVGGTVPWLVASAVVFGAGFGSAYPVFAAFVLRHVASSRRGAAFGGIIAAFDTGIGTGSIATGWLIERIGFQRAFGVSAIIAAFAPLYFVLTHRLISSQTPAGGAPASGAASEARAAEMVP